VTCVLKLTQFNTASDVWSFPLWNCYTCTPNICHTLLYHYGF